MKEPAEARSEQRDIRQNGGKNQTGVECQADPAPSTNGEFGLLSSAFPSGPKRFDGDYNIGTNRVGISYERRFYRALRQCFGVAARS